MNTENLFQIFSQVFIESQQSFSKCDVELRSKCRILSEKLAKFVNDLEEDPFKASLESLSTIEEETLQIVRKASELETRREYIKESVESLKESTKTKMKRG